MESSSMPPVFRIWKKGTDSIPLEVTMAGDCWVVPVRVGVIPSCCLAKQRRARVPEWGGVGEQPFDKALLVAPGNERWFQAAAESPPP